MVPKPPTPRGRSSSECYGAARIASFRGRSRLKPLCCAALAHTGIISHDGTTRRGFYTGLHATRATNLHFPLRQIEQHLLLRFIFHFFVALPGRLLVALPVRLLFVAETNGSPCVHMCPKTKWRCVSSHRACRLVQFFRLAPRCPHNPHRGRFSLVASCGHSSPVLTRSCRRRCSDHCQAPYFYTF